MWSYNRHFRYLRIQYLTSHLLLFLENYWQFNFGKRWKQAKERITQGPWYRWHQQGGQGKEVWGPEPGPGGQEHRPEPDNSGRSTMRSLRSTSCTQAPHREDHRGWNPANAQLTESDNGLESWVPMSHISWQHPRQKAVGEGELPPCLELSSSEKLLIILMGYLEKK